jgi:hypothetical protein
MSNPVENGRNWTVRQEIGQQRIINRIGFGFGLFLAGASVLVGREIPLCNVGVLAALVPPAIALYLNRLTIERTGGKALDDVLQ